MIKVNSAALLALSALVLGSTSTAQVIMGPRVPGVAPRSNDGGVHERNDLPVCQTSGGGSRIKRANCEPASTVVHTPARSPAREFRLPLKPPARLREQCTGTITTEYQQLNTLANVHSVVEIADCTAASGSLTIAVRVRDGSGESKSLEFVEPWQRADQQDVTVAADYLIGDNAELLNVRVRDVSCTCADPAEEE